MTRTDAYSGRLDAAIRGVEERAAEEAMLTELADRLDDARDAMYVETLGVLPLDRLVASWDRFERRSRSRGRSIR